MKINMPTELRMMTLHGSVIEWLCETNNHHLIEPYNQFEDRMVEFLMQEDKTFKGVVVPCQHGEFHGIDCLEDSTQYGFFKDDNDVRPSSCTWIEKEKAEKLYNLFAFGGKTE